MSQAVYGFTKSLQASYGASNVLGPVGNELGFLNVILRTSSAGVFVGGADVANAAPTTGFELVPDKEYEITTILNELFVYTTSATLVQLSVFVTPKV